MRSVRIRHIALATAVALAGSFQAPPTHAEAASLPDSASEVRPLLVGSEAPSVTLRKPDGSNFDLKAAIEKKPTILVFYRGGW